MGSGIRTKKGFTLIELLAVIVIIGVIALITYPTVNRVITNSRMTALKNSAEALLKETNLQTAMDKVEDNTQILITDERLKLKNNQFISGFIFKNADGKLELKNVTNGSFCINGTSGKLKVEKGNCSYSDTSAPALTLQTGYVGATEAMVLAKGTDNESGIRGYEYKIGNGSYTELQSDNFYQFEGLNRNTSYKVTVRVTNGAGLTTEKSITFKTKSISAATFVVSDASKWTNKKDVTINYPTRENGVTYRYKIGTGSWQVLTSGKKKELEVKENTTIYAEVILNGETVSSNVSITKIDNTAPVITSIKPNTTSWTRQVTIQVIATDTPSGIAGYSFNDGATWTNAPTYTTTKNGTYKIKVKDYANNITSGKITINNIDRTGPKCVSSGGNKTWTNQSRTIVGTCIDDGEGAGCVSKTISKTISTDVNATMSPGVVKDEAGNETTCPATEVVRVDKTKPTCTSSGGSSNWVVGGSLTLTGKCSDDGSGCKGDATKTFYPETDTTTASPGTVYDNVGNSAACPGNQQVHVTNKLDAPIITNPTGGNWVNYNYALTVKTPNNKVSVAYWQWKYASTNWTTYSNSAKNTFTTTQFTTERNEAVYVHYCLSNGVCSPEASTMIRIDKTAPRWSVTMHRGAYTNKAGQTAWYTCYAAINYVDNRNVDSGLGWRRNITGNSGSVIGSDVNFNGPKLLSLDFSDIDILGSFGAYYVSYGFTICDMAGNCATQGRTTGYC